MKPLFNHRISTAGCLTFAAVFAVLSTDLGLARETLATATAKGTGRTTGHIATLSVTNPTRRPLVYELPVSFIPSSGKYQSYVVTHPTRETVPSRSTVNIPMLGYCADIRRPPVPDGAAMPPPDTWVPGGKPPDLGTIRVSPRGPYRPAPPPFPAVGRGLVALYPGTDTPLPFVLDVDAHPDLAAPLLIAAVVATEAAFDQLAGEGLVSTPFSATPQREREAVVQQTFWIFAAALKGETYTREDFTQRLQTQLEEISGRPLEEAPPPVKEQFEQGADDFWHAFSLVGVEAKVISVPGETQGDATAPVAPVAVAAAGCPPTKDEEHTPKTIRVVVADSYGNRETREEIRQGLHDALENTEGGYMLGTPPATAFALWGHDHIGGSASAYAKTIFLEENGQDWVWSTDPMSVTAEGTGVHTLAFTPPAGCAAVVSGAALKWIKASSSAFDPLENSIEAFRALDAVKELSVKYATRKLPPGISDAIEAGVEALTDPSSDTYAAAIGAATLTVGGKSATVKAENRVVYKRKDKEDKAIVGGGERVERLLVSDTQANSLTSSVTAQSTMEAGAKGNGFANAYLESLYGTILVGVCECEGGVIYEIMTDVGLFIRSETAGAQSEHAVREMQKKADGIARDIIEDNLELTGEALKQRAEEDLQAWAEATAGHRFPTPESE